MKRHPWHVHVRIHREGSARAVLDKSYSVKAGRASTAAGRAVRAALAARHLKLTRITSVTFTVRKVPS